MNSIAWTKSSSKSSLAFSAFAAILFIAPALRAQQPAPNPNPSPIPPPSQPAPASPNAPTEPVPANPPSAGASPSSHLMRTWRRLSYTCDGDAKVIVNLHAKEARLVFKDHTYNMKQVDESDGQKYTDGSLIWRNKGEDGSLERAKGDNKSLATSCHLQSAATNPPPRRNNSPTQP
jgi:membrane-bound inhibitor of C-type lysozyme